MGRRIGSLFSGAGGLDLAVQAVFGGEVVWHSEIDKAASKVLAYRFPGVPNLGDITQVEWADVPAVDVLCGGFPCQDVSAAGRRAGIKDSTRSGLWAVFADAIDALRPQWVVIENVRGLLSATAHRDVESDETDVGNGAGRPVLRAAGAVLGDLADLGYDAQWATVAAADVGAPHRRERVFILASRAVSYAGHDAGRPEQGVKYEEQTGGVGEPSCRVAADTDAGRLGTRFRTPRSAQRVESETLAGVARTSSARLPSDSQSYGRHEGRPESAGLVGGFDAAVSGDQLGVALLPTPCVVDRLATTDMTLEQWDESRRSQKERGVGSFGPRGDSLGAAILRVEEGSERPDYSTTKSRRGGDEPGVALLPTPNAVDGAGGGRYSSAGHQSTLPGEVRLLPTPRSSDCFGAGQHGDGGMDLRTTISLLPTPRRTDFQGKDSEGEWTRHSPSPDATTYHFPDQQWGKYAPAIRRWESIVGSAPAPTEPNKNGNPRLSAAFSEWLMGWPQGWVTHPDIGISRNDQLRIIGNGVCPQQATAALRFLLPVSEVTA